MSLRAFGHVVQTYPHGQEAITFHVNMTKVMFERADASSLISTVDCSGLLRASQLFSNGEEQLQEWFAATRVFERSARRLGEIHQCRLERADCGRASSAAKTRRATTISETYQSPSPSQPM